MASDSSGSQIVAARSERGEHVAFWGSIEDPPDRFERSYDDAIVAVALSGGADVTDMYLVDASGCVWSRSVAGGEAYDVASFNLFRLHRTKPPLADEMATTSAFVCVRGDLGYRYYIPCESFSPTFDSLPRNICMVT